MVLPYDEHFKRSLRLLNAIQCDDTPWRDAVSDREQNDLFGDTIKPGELFFRRQEGELTEILARSSMEALLKILFSNGYYADALAQKLQTDPAPETTPLFKLNMWV